MRANQIMTRDVVCVSSRMKLADAYRLMRSENVRHLPVMEAGRLVGIVSDRDLLTRGWMRPDNTVGFDDSMIVDAMTVAPVSCPSGATVGRIAKLMLEHKIDSIPIVAEDEHLIGLVTSSDLLELLCDPEQDSKVIPFHFLVRTLETSEARA